MTFDLCPQRQVRHPFVHDLQDCWQTQRHLYISESARDPNPTQNHYPKPPHTSSPVQNLPTTPDPTPTTRLLKKTLVFLFWLFCLETLNPTTPIHRCLCILYLLCPRFPFPVFFPKSATDSESVTQIVCCPTPL